MTAPATDPGQYLLFVLEKKAVLITEYLNLTRAMRDSFASEKEIHLNGGVTKRQACIEKVEKIDLLLKKIKTVGVAPLSHLSREVKARVDGVLHRLKVLMEQTAMLDAEVMTLVGEESRGIKEELERMKQTRQAARGYGSKGKLIPRYIDARG